MSTASAATTTEAKPTYVGLWIKEDRNGSAFLSGSTDETVYFVFSDQKDTAIKKLYTKPKMGEGKLVLKGAFENLEGPQGSYKKLDNICIFVNTKKSQPDDADYNPRHPDFNLVIYND